MRDKLSQICTSHQMFQVNIFLECPSMVVPVALHINMHRPNDRETNAADSMTSNEARSM